MAEACVNVGFHGLAGSGKDYSADLLCRLVVAVDGGYYSMAGLYGKISFADPIRDFATSFFGHGWREWKNGNSKREMDYWGFSPRQFMQVAGEKIRSINPKAFVMSLRWRLNDSMKVAAIHDVRHINEAEMIREEGGVVIGITTDGRGIHNGRRTWFRRVKDWIQGRFRHKTERAIPCDVWLVNDRGEDYEWRLLEAILQAHGQRSTPS